MLEYKFQHLDEIDADGNHIPVEARQIEKKGVLVHFTLNEVLGDLVAFDKKLKELEGMRVLHTAKVTNIVRQNPFVTEMSEHDRLAVYLYHEADAIVKQTDVHTKTILEEKAKLLDEVKDIKDQIPDLREIAVVSEPMPTDAYSENAKVGQVMDSQSDANTENSSSGESDTQAASGEQKAE